MRCATPAPTTSCSWSAARSRSATSPALEAAGAAAVYPTGTELEALVESIKELTAEGVADGS